MENQELLGWKATDGGGGGNFLRSIIRRHRPDVLHVHWLHPYMIREGVMATWGRGLRFLLEIRLIRLSGIKIVWTVHNLSNHDNKHARIETLLTRRFVKLCDLVIAHGQNAADAAKKRFAIPDSVRVAAIRHPCYTPEGYHRRCAEKPDSETFTIGFFGRIEPYKQVESLVQAFQGVCGDDARLLIAGKASDDTYANIVLDAIGNDKRIRFRNEYIEDSEATLIADSIDIMACPSKGILTSGSVVFAMSHGIPVIAPSEGCITEDVGDAGYLYENDAGGLEGALRNALESRHQWQSLGVKALERTRESSPHAIATQTIREYTRLLDSKNNS